MDCVEVNSDWIEIIIGVIDLQRGKRIFGILDCQNI